MTNYREILRLSSLQYSQRTIESMAHCLNIPSEMVLSDRADGACRPQKWCSAAVCMVHSYGFR